MTHIIANHICTSDEQPSIERIAEDAIPKVVPNDTQNILAGIIDEPNPYLAFAGIFADDPLMAEADAYIAAERQRERGQTVQEADA